MIGGDSVIAQFDVAEWYLVEIRGLVEGGCFPGQLIGAHVPGNVCVSLDPCE